MTAKLSLKARTYALETLSQSSSPMDSMQVMREVNTRLYKESIQDPENYNWHLYGYYLQELECKGLVKTLGISPNGLTRYQIAK